VIQPRHLRIDPRSYRLDGRFFRRVYNLSKLYWTRKDAWKSWIALGILTAMVMFYSLSGAYYSYLTRDQTNALVARHAGLFWDLLALTVAFMAVRQIIYAAESYIDGRLNLDWRQWLTTHLVDEYLARRTYYEIAMDEVIDNPDQRMQEEVGPFCQTISYLPRQAFGMVLDMSVQALILMTISGALFWAVVVFAAFKTVVILRLYKPTIKQNYDITVSEADLRYGILHVRDHAETVAFYHGEYAERAHILVRLGTAIHKNFVNIVYMVWMGLAEGGFGVVWTVMPFVFLAPLYLSHRVEYGTIAQGSASAAALLNSLSLLMRFIPTLTFAVPKVIRLAEIQEKFEALGQARISSAEVPRIAFHEGDQIALDKVSIETPGGEQFLVRDVSFRVAPREHMVIVGRTGVGKSSLLRAMAGLWTRGAGEIVMPPHEATLFLPQKPYMILANLREQILYPRRRTDLSDEELQVVLERVTLHDLAECHGGFDSEKDWGRVLSLGEQQRIGFARVLVNRPQFVLMDEATSAVDVETERLLYGLLARTGATFVSVGHRPTIFKYHRKALRLLPGGGWEILPAGNIAPEDAGDDAEAEAGHDPATAPGIARTAAQ
jgi:vitamin B12/bleomycin/antimicrobial peptide transport system ATP-binding/permease protein